MSEEAKDVPELKSETFSVRDVSSPSDPQLEDQIQSQSVSSPSENIPEDENLRPMNMSTNPSKDDLVKRLVREGRLDVGDVMEFVTASGHILGSKVLPHAEEKYNEELRRVEEEEGDGYELHNNESKLMSEKDGSYFDPDPYAIATSQRSSFFELEGLEDEDEDGGEYEPDYEEEELEADRGDGLKQEDNAKTQGDAYSFGMEGPKSVESLYSMIEPDREVEFNEQIEVLNREMANMQHEICMEHKERQLKKVKRFIFEKKLIQNAVSEAGILYLPGNFLEPITGRRIEDSDIPEILEALKELQEAEVKGFNLAYNQITDEGITLLAPFIKDREAIMHINLSHNDFTAVGMYTLVTSLIGRVSLHTLNLTGVKVGDEGINSITCLYMCGKGPRDLDVSETDMTTPGFQALCTAFQAVDDDEDYPKFLTKYELPFSLETLTRLKMENHEFLKAQTYHRLCHSQFELIPPRGRTDQSRVDELNQQLREGNEMKMPYLNEKAPANDELVTALENAFKTSLLGGGDTAPPSMVDLTTEAELAVEFTEQSNELPPIDDFIEVHKNMQDKGCKPSQPDGRPVIICPSLYSLELDEFDEEAGGDSILGKGGQHIKKVNPMYMDTLVEPVQVELEVRDTAGKDVVDNVTADKASVKFVKGMFNDAGAVAGVSDYTSDSDKAQLLLITILNNAKKFLQAESEGAAPDLTLPELKVIWEHSLQTSLNIFRPAIPAHCGIKEEALDVFVEEFMKISSGTFYKLIQVPFFQDLFEHAATKGCADFTATHKLKDSTYPAEPIAMSHQDCVKHVILKFLGEIIVRAADIVGGGDPSHIRGSSAKSDEDDGRRLSIMDIDMGEEIVTPLVEQLFEAGGLLAKDALACKEENENSQDEGVEPAKQYLEGIFKQLSNFLYQMKDDDKKLAERMEKSPKKFTFSTKPVRLVMNRPFFTGQEPVMASKLATFLRLNQQLREGNEMKMPYLNEKAPANDELVTALENAFKTSLLGGGDTAPPSMVDLTTEAELAVEFTEQSNELPPIDDFIEVHKNMQDKGCKPSQPDGRPVIICPSLYSLELDEFDEEAGGDSILGKGGQHIKKVNPMYMDTLVEPVQVELEVRDTAGKDVVDNVTADKASVKFVKGMFNDAGAVAGVSDYTSDSDKAQLLLITILNNAKKFLQAESEGAAPDLTLPELKVIWEHSLQTSLNIFRPAIPAHCGIKEEALDVFVEEFMKISSGTFYKLIQVPFFQDLFEHAATKGCADFTATHKLKDSTYPAEPIAMSHQDCVKHVILKFLGEIIVRAADIVGGGDPSHIRGSSAKSDEDDGRRLSIMDIDMGEEIVTPLVEQLFEAGGLLAKDALACKEENENSQDEGVEPAKQYLEGIFKQLSNFLYQMKDDDKKLAERMEKSPKKFTFSTKPVRLVMNRPFFTGQEPVMASKLATFLRNNDSVQCLHLRKWGLGEDGTVNLMTGIASNMNIVTLDLSLNGIGSEGMQAIAEYVRRNQNLKHLLLNHNRLRNPGMIALANALPESSLFSLNVAYNDATEGGLNPLLEALANSNVYSLYILGNCFSQTSCSLLADLFESQSLNKPDCDVEIKEVDGEKILAVNSQARDLNEWYAVPVRVDLELVCPPYFSEHYSPPKVSIFGAVDVEV